jgi:hypothetical protein
MYTYNTTWSRAMSPTSFFLLCAILVCLYTHHIHVCTHEWSMTQSGGMWSTSFFFGVYYSYTCTPISMYVCTFAQLLCFVGGLLYPSTGGSWDAKGSVCMWNFMKVYKRADIYSTYVHTHVWELLAAYTTWKESYTRIRCSCMYVCMYVSTTTYVVHVCMYVCMFVCMYACVCVCMHVVFVHDAQTNHHSLKGPAWACRSDMPHPRSPREIRYVLKSVD